MNKTPHHIGPVDSLSFQADVADTFRNYRPAATSTVYQGVQPDDGVALSQESLDAGEDHSDELCGSLLAAWG